MANQVNMEFNTDNAKTVSGNIESKASEIQRSMDQVKNQMDQVSTWWKGESQKKFSAQYDKIKPNVQKLIQSVNNISAQLKEVSIAKMKEEDDIQRELNKTR